MKCVYCGFKNEKGVKFCPRCGQQTEGVPKAAGAAPSHIIPKNKNRKKNTYTLYQILISILISVITVSFLVFPFGIMVITAAESADTTGFSLCHGILCLTEGSGRYNPTVLSIVIGFGTLLFTFAVPVFQLFNIIASVSKKSDKGIRKISHIMTSIALFLECAMVPLAYKLVPSFKAIYAREANVPASDITGIASWWAVAAAILVIGLMIVSSVTAHKKNAIER